jgi:signal transduction histidine kinase
MPLSDFIEQNMERILVEWEAFAATCTPAAHHMDRLQLRNHGRQILEAISADLRAPQSRDEQMAKSRGLAPVVPGAAHTAAQTHAVLRAHSGFDIRQLASEYRALRASVLRMWLDEVTPGPTSQDMIRFNEAIDQALAESIAFYSEQVERSRSLLLGMLGHDMRTPLQAIRLTAQVLKQLQAGEQVNSASERLIRCSQRLQVLLDDLHDFNRAQLGLGIQVRPASIDLANVCQEEMDELQAAYPQRELQLETDGDCRGHWDGHRLKQLIGNLVGNALKYGTQDQPVHVQVQGEADEVILRVSNSGPTIDAETLGSLFQPLKRGKETYRGDDPSLGLGLYIASEIAKAHQGRIDAASHEGHTVFTVRLPRRQATAPSH